MGGSRDKAKLEEGDGVMGWCSGTDVFDAVVKVVLDEKKPLTPERVVETLILALQDMDWDCESDSDYWNHPMVRKAFKKACPDWNWQDIED